MSWVARPCNHGPGHLILPVAGSALSGDPGHVGLCAGTQPLQPLLLVLLLHVPRGCRPSDK